METDPARTCELPVGLPAPFGPMMPKISPGYTENDTSSTPAAGPYNLRSRSTLTTGGLAGEP